MTPPAHGSSSGRFEAPRTVGISRRALLRTSAVAGVGTLVLAACGGDAPSDPVATDLPDLETEVVEAARVAGFGDATPDLSVIVASSEVLTGSGQRLSMGLLDPSGEPAPGLQLEVVIVRSGTLEVVQRISKPLFHDEGLGARGVYVMETDIPDEGNHFLIVGSDGHVGAAVLRVIAPDKSTTLQPGAAVPAVATATVTDPQDLAELCTRTPDCTMHDVALDDALAQGKPIVVVVATPEFCQTAVCGPVVDVVEQAKQERSDQDIIWIHTEVFSDAGNTPVPIVGAFGLQSEPWTFLVNRDGTVADRFEGPVVPSLLAEAIAALQ